MKACEAQAIANTAWAFATVGQKNEPLFTALAKAAERRMKDFEAQAISNTAWALTDSAACTLGSWCSGALGGGVEGDGSRAE